MKERIIDRTYFRKKYNKEKIINQALKAEIYDLRQQIKSMRKKENNDKHILAIIRGLPKSKKKELGIIE